MALAVGHKTVVGVFNTVSDAQDAVRDLEAQGISRDEISIVANKNAVGYETMDPTMRDKTSDVVADAGIGAAIGGVGGLLLSAAGALTLPVIGPILAAGPIAAALTGAGIGAAAGGLIGALTESGIPEDEAKHYAEGVRRGDVLVTVRADQTKVDQVCNIMDRNNAIDVDDRVQTWRERGWSGYREDAAPFSDEEFRNERRFYTGTLTGAEGIGVDRERSRLSSETGTSTTGTMGATGLSGAGLGTTGTTLPRTEDTRSLTEKAGDKMREWGSDVKQKGRELRNEAKESEQRMTSSEPGRPYGDTSNRLRDNIDEMGRDVKEAARDTRDVLTGRTTKQPHDYMEDAREAERRRRARVYDRY